MKFPPIHFAASTGGVYVPRPYLDLVGWDVAIVHSEQGAYAYRTNRGTVERVTATDITIHDFLAEKTLTVAWDRVDQIIFT